MITLLTPVVVPLLSQHRIQVEEAAPRRAAEYLSAINSSAKQNKALQLTARSRFLN